MALGLSRSESAYWRNEWLDLFDLVSLISMWLPDRWPGLDPDIFTDHCEAPELVGWGGTHDPDICDVCYGPTLLMAETVEHNPMLGRVHACLPCFARVGP